MKQIWSRAISLAERTPEERNRYVDFLRAVSILMVVTGHWLVAAPWMQDGTFVPGDLLEMRPQTQWLTWIFQVMPIFFIVGGYANAVSLESAHRKGVRYAGWLAGRLYRLVTPLLGLLVGWGILALALYFSGVAGDTTRLVTRAALIPTWFLAIYIAIVMLAPLTYRAWQRWGFASLLGLAAMAALVDVAFFVADMRWTGWTQYFWVWLTVHQLGYAWRDGRIGSPVQLLVLSALGFATLWALIFNGPYPFAMVGSPDEGLSNTLPPKITLIALGVCQFGLLMSIEKPMRRFLSGVRIWAATVLINSMIMTLYLWHITVMIVVVVIAYFAADAALALEPGTSEWWASRPLWIAFLGLILLGVTALLGRFEQRSRAGIATAPPLWRSIGGALAVCAALATLALGGITTGEAGGIRIGALTLGLAGAALVLDFPRWRGGAA